MAPRKRKAAESILTIPPPSALAALSDPQVGLTEVLKLLFPDDAALQRAVDRLRRMRYVHPTVAFDGLEATFQSSSQGDEEYHRVGLDDDGEEPTIVCTCPGRGHPWCIHRLRFRLELAELALRDPVELLDRVMSQAATVYGTPSPQAPPLPTTTWRMPEDRLPDSLPRAPVLPPCPPPLTDADRRDASPGPTRPRLAGPAARREVEELLASLEEEYPL
jgi:hypothetical protein